MDILVEFLLLFIGVILLKWPMIVVKITAMWPRFIFGKLLPNRTMDNKLSEAIRLLEQDPVSYSKEFSGQFTIIRITGLVSLFVAVMGFCITILSWSSQ